MLLLSTPRSSESAETKSTSPKDVAMNQTTSPRDTSNRFPSCDTHDIILQRLHSINEDRIVLLPEKDWSGELTEESALKFGITFARTEGLF